MKVIDLISGILALISGSGFLFLWYRDEKHPSQKKLGFGFLIIGALSQSSHRKRMKTLENQGFLTTPGAMGRSVPAKTPGTFQIPNKINSFEHVSYGTALEHCYYWTACSACFSGSPRWLRLTRDMARLNAEMPYHNK